MNNIQIKIKPTDALHFCIDKSDRCERGDGDASDFRMLCKAAIRGDEWKEEASEKGIDADYIERAAEEAIIGAAGYKDLAIELIDKLGDDDFYMETYSLVYINKEWHQAEF